MAIPTTVVLAAALALAASAPAAGDAIPASQAPAQIGECVNMANMMESPKEGAWGRTIADDDFAIIATAGFKTVRLPVAFGAHASAAAPYTIVQSFLDRVANVVGLAEKAHLGLIIDLHNDDRLFTDPADESPRLAAMWRQIAARFKDAPANVWFEITNEPHDKLTNGNLMATLGPSLAAIRATNPTRKVVIGGEGWSGIDSLATLELPDDPNLVTTFHYYLPMTFTHQGASWVHPTPPLGATFGSTGDLAQLDANVAKARAYMARTHRPLFLGEYGAYDKTIPTNQRAAYYKSVHDAFSRAGIDGCVWGYTSSFKFRDADHWIEPLMKAIGL